MKTIVGIDVGTTNINAAPYHLVGEMKAFATRKTITHHPKPQYSEFDAEEIWESVRSCLSELATHPCCRDINSIGVSFFGESSVIVGADEMPIFPTIAWYDRRATNQTQKLLHITDEKELYKITGQTLSSKCGTLKLLWIKDNVPEVFAKAYKCLTVRDYIIHRLTGVFATDYSMASL